MIHLSRLAEEGFKPPKGAVVKSHGTKRLGRVHLKSSPKTEALIIKVKSMTRNDILFMVVVPHGIYSPQHPHITPILTHTQTKDINTT